MMKKNKIRLLTFIGLAIVVTIMGCKILQSTSENEMYLDGDWLIYSNKWGQGELIKRIFKENGVFIDVYYSKTKPVKAYFEDGKIVADTFLIDNGVLYYKINHKFSPFLSKYVFNIPDTVCDYRGAIVENPSIIIEGMPCYEPYFKYVQESDTIYVFSDIYRNSKLHSDRKNFFGIEFHPEMGISAYYMGREGKFSLVPAKEFGFP